MTTDSGTALEEARPPAYIGRRIRLRAMDPGDYEWLHTVGLGPEEGWRWRFRGSTPSPEAHIQTLWSDSLVSHIATMKAAPTRVAYLSAMRSDFRNGHCYFVALADPAFSRTAYAGEAIMLFLVQLMQNFPFRKVYFETAEFNLAQFLPAVSRFAQEEGRLREYEYYDGRLWDYLIFSISRATIEDKMAPLVRPIDMNRPGSVG